MLIDTHCHLNFDAFDKDYQEVARRCQEKDMKLVIVGSQIETSRKAVQIAHDFDHIFASIGLHPIHIQDENFIKEEYLPLAEDNITVAIGETGLDYYRIWADSDEEELKVKEKQKEVLRSHLDIAREVRKPVILHCRDAYQDLLEILKNEKGIQAVVHCFLGDRKTGEDFLNLGLNLGFTGIITFTDDKNLLDFVCEVPLERIFLETDAPYLSPEGFRDKRNEPLHVLEVAKKIAELKKIPVEKVIEQTAINAQGFFRI